MEEDHNHLYEVNNPPDASSGMVLRLHDETALRHSPKFPTSIRCPYMDARETPSAAQSIRVLAANGFAVDTRGARRVLGDDRGAFGVRFGVTRGWLGGLRRSWQGLC